MVHQKPGFTDKDIPNLVKELTRLLHVYWDGTPQDRDRLVDRCGYDLGGLLAILDPLTMNREERERSIKLAKEFQ